MQKEIVNLIEYEKMIKTLLIYLINLSAVLSIPGHTSVFNNLSEINDDTVEIAIKQFKDYLSIKLIIDTI